MADMPSNTHPTPRPSPPASRGGRTGSRSPQRGSAGQFLRPDSHDSAVPRDRGSRSRSRGGQFATTREEFPFTDDEEDYRGSRQSRKNGHATQDYGEDHPNDGDEEQEEEEDGADGLYENDDYYSILNISRSANANQIRMAYHSLSRRFHPDKQPPEMREQATKHFNEVLVAYETLINPHKRIVYDKWGIQGLKDRTWQLGVRSMNPEQFKFWLEANMREQRVEQLDELVNSTGSIIAGFNISGLWFNQLILRRNDKGKVVGSEIRPLPIGVMTKYIVKHSFHVPLDTFGEILEKPFPTSLKDLWAETEKPPQKLGSAPKPTPTLSLECSLRGRAYEAPEAGQKLLPSVIAASGLTATMAHLFPGLPPDAPRSVASVLAGKQVVLHAVVLPSPMIMTQVQQAFGQNRLTTQATFHNLHTPQAPVIELTLQRRLALRHTVYVGLNGGSNGWLSSLKDILRLPAVGRLRGGFASMGYVYTPIANGPIEEPEADGDTMQSNRSRSQRTETYTVVVTAGVLASGIQTKLSWGRTFFVGTPLDSIQPGRSRANVGIRIGLDATVHVTGASQWTIKATRKLFENTTLGLSASCGGTTGSDGVVLGLTWSRLGQKITIPVVIAPVPDSKVMVYATAIPFLAYVATELLVLRPRERKIRERETARLRRALRSKTLRRRKAAEEAAEVMRAAVERKMQAERAAGGLVVVRATYGAENGKLVADVTVAVAALVEQGQLVLSRGVDKSKIIGFYDPAPGSEKVLTVRYLFKGKVHEGSVKGSQPLMAPLRSHLVPGQD